MRRPGQIAAGTFPFFTPLHLPLGFRTVAWAAECLKVGVQTVDGTAAVIYVVDFECCSCGVVVPTLGALVAVAVEYAASGCGGYVLGGVCPDHHSPFFFVPCSSRELAACISGGQLCKKCPH